MYRSTTLGELLTSTGGSIKTGPFGTTLKATEYSSSGVPVVSVGEVGYGKIRLKESTPRVDKEVTSRLPEYILRHGDLVFGRKGAVDRSAWVQQHEDGYFLGSDGIRVRFDSVTESRFMAYQFQSTDSRDWLLQHASGTTMLSLNQKILERVPIVVPERGIQVAIGEVLGALDDKIAANDKALTISRKLARSTFSSAAHRESRVPIRKMTQLVARGITPNYTESDGVVVLNQKCIRNQQIDLTPSRMTAGSSIRREKLLQRDDVLVNSTGAGTLGRAARWIQDIHATVDSHITIVRFDPTLVDPVFAGFGLLQIENEIEGLAEGSTGQTELRRDLLTGLEIAIPNKAMQVSLGAELTALDELALGLRRESDRLAVTRDELVPLLMSGKVHVRDAEKVVEGVV